MTVAQLTSNAAATRVVGLFEGLNRRLAKDLGGGITTQQWVVDAYLITLGALILVAGSVSDVYGRILVMRIGLVAFGVSSIAIAAAPSTLLA